MMVWGEVIKHFLNGFNTVMENAETLVADKVRNVERSVVDRFYQVKRLLFRSVMEILMLLVALLFIIIGAVMFVDRFLSLDIVLLVAGLLILNIVLITAKFKR